MDMAKPPLMTGTTIFVHHIIAVRFVTSVILEKFLNVLFENAINKETANGENSTSKFLLFLIFFDPISNSYN
jgi:hypothetical protein